MPSKSSPFDLRLRPIRVDDVDAIMEWINDPEVTRNFAGIRGRITREQEVDFLEQMIASENDRLYAIEALDGTYLGNAGLHKIYWPARNARLGIVIGSPKARGQGRGQQVLKLLLAKAFIDLGLHKVWLIHFVTNRRMAHITQKLGFKGEGTLRDEYYTDRFHDMCRVSMLEDEFRNLAPDWGFPTASASG